jgi:hypothetical protein
MSTHTAAHPITRYQTTEYNPSERILSRLRDIYGRAQSFHMHTRKSSNAWMPKFTSPETGQN